TAHPVGDDEYGRARERVVLVVAALAAGVGPQGCLCRPKHLNAASDRSLLVGELAVADPNPVPGPQRLGAVEGFFVQIRAVGGSQIFDHKDMSLSRNSRMLGRRKRILKVDLHVAAAERSA